MIINGKKLSEKVIEKINKDLKVLSKKGIIPKIVIITLGPETSWKSYVGQKIKLAERLNVIAKHISLSDTKEETLLTLLKELNNDKNIHGIIVQRPLPPNISRTKIIETINPEKDVDGFKPNSKFTSPIWLAISDMLHNVKKSKIDFYKWLMQKNIVIVGKGETGGKPIIDFLRKHGLNPIVIDSKTGNANGLLKKADIIISATGKSGIIKKNNIKNRVVLIGIGMHRQESGLEGDYNEEEIEKIASYYSTTPGGVGPLNMAYLFNNLIRAVKIQQNT